MTENPVSDLLRIDVAIFTIDKNICDNIDSQTAIGCGLMSQNVLAQLRNLVEHVAMKITSQDRDIEPNYDAIKEAMKQLQGYGKDVKFILDFHKLLQISESHYTVDYDGSERLLTKYLSYLVKIKYFMEKKYNVQILHNINAINVGRDSDVEEYYSKVATAIERSAGSSNGGLSLDRYYIQNNKPFFINGKIYYEVTFTIVNSNASKFDRITAFTDQEIFDNYAVKLQIYSSSITVMGIGISISIVRRWEVSIRPCEIRNFSKILGFKIELDTQQTEYKKLMDFLTTQKYSLADVVKMSESIYLKSFVDIYKKCQTRYFCDVVDRCREIVLNDKPGSNVLLYLLHNVNNNIIKQQYKPVECTLLSDLYLNYGCIPFDKMPFATSLIRHNPFLFDLMDCIDVINRDYELLARSVKNNSEQNGSMFTAIDDFHSSDKIDEDITKYNSALYHKHFNRKLVKYGNYVYIKEYLDDFKMILGTIQRYVGTGLVNYAEGFSNWRDSGARQIDSPDKVGVLSKLFVSSRVALIYGSAGTGKTTLIDYVSSLFNSSKKLYLANTNPAVDNLRRKVFADNTTFFTVKKYLSSQDYDQYDMLIVDECSTVSNMDMKDVLSRNNFKLLIMVGDVYQIEAIRFGNWFNLINSFLPKNVSFDLKTIYRSTKKRLLDVWGYVRNNDVGILEYLTKYDFISKLDDTIFDITIDDQIILCLNYNGPYGINNLNHIMQGSNENIAVQWELNTYKVGDPVLFNESCALSPQIYNNLKGEICRIEKTDNAIQFDIKLVIEIGDFILPWSPFKLVSTVDGRSTIRFIVHKCRNTDDDNDSTNTIVPFNVAYAVSIHKSQGLEYDSVKVVISDEVGDLITRNIFYTAITRARKNLKIYCSVNTGNGILDSLKLIDYNKEVQLICGICGIKGKYQKHL